MKKPMRKPTKPRLTIREYDGINYTPAMHLAHQGMAELELAGLAEPCCVLHHEQNALVGFWNNKPVAVIVWNAAAWRKEAFINLGYVLPLYRRRGIYTALYAKLKETAKRLGLNHIMGMTSIKNTKMRESAKKSGRKEIAITLYEDI